MSERVVVGYVVKAHGVKGELRVRTDSAVVLGAKELFLGDQHVAWKIRHARRERDDLLIELHGVDDRNAADALRGQTVSLLRSELPEPDDDEVYVTDLIGCQVVDLAGTVLGSVRSSYFGGAHELLDVVDSTGREFLLPFVDGIVVEVDVQGRRVVCDPPPGLVDLEQPQKRADER